MARRHDDGPGGKQPERPRAHDPEDTSRRGMSSEGVVADEAETMASTGNSESAFLETVTGTATGVGIDRAESIGTGGLAEGEDLDPVAEGDYWRQNLRREPYADAEGPYEHSTEALLDARKEGDEDLDGGEEEAEAFDEAEEEPGG